MQFEVVVRHTSMEPMEYWLRISRPAKGSDSIFRRFDSSKAKSSILVIPYFINFGSCYNSIGYFLMYQIGEIIKFVENHTGCVARSGKWDIQYPDHKLPKRRYDIIVNQLLVAVFLSILIYKCASKWIISQCRRCQINDFRSVSGYPIAWK